MIRQPSDPHNSKYMIPMKYKRIELLLAYEKANQVREFHVPPNHRLG